MPYIVNLFAVFLLLLFAVKYDVIERRIPNKLTLSVVLWGLFSSVIFGGLQGIIDSFFGLFVGLAIFIIPFSMGGMGAGDVKLMAAVGSLIGWKLTVYSALLTAIAGGIIVIGYTLYKGNFFRMMKNIGISVYKTILYLSYTIVPNEKFLNKYNSLHVNHIENDKMYIPYGVAIAIGTLIVIIGKFIGYPPLV